VGQTLREAAAQLADTSPTPRLDAELLMAEALGVTRSELLLGHMAAPVPAAFATLLARRARAEPIAYILGRREFYGLELAITRDVLIPRWDSETLIQAAREERGERPPHRILDLGTGSGALLLAALWSWPGAQGIGTDRSPAALAVASGNAARLGMAGRAGFAAADWNLPGWSAGLGRFDLVLANPPYVESTAALDRGVRDYEPAEALFAGADGLDAYRVLVPQLAGLLAPAGIAVLEIGAGQGQAVAALAGACGMATTLRRDLAGHPRALVAKF
jgi:release factor glutamine methyltransferase